MSLADSVAVDPHKWLYAPLEAGTTFRYVPRDLRDSLGESAVERHLDALNRELLDRLQRGDAGWTPNCARRLQRANRPPPRSRPAW